MRIYVALGIVAAAAAGTVSRRNRDDGEIPAYRNAQLRIDDRIDDLLSRMSLEEKAGQMYHARTNLVNNTLDPETLDLITKKHITHYVFSEGVSDARIVAEWQNKLQQFARGTGLGIPITISSDPQHAWTDDTALSNFGAGFSRWTETMGIAALRSPQLARTFAEIVREEYLAVGLRQALHPQVDIMTEPRWGRNFGTMGEDANLTVSLLAEYIQGLQGDEIGPFSVIATTKHFPGHGPLENGEDSHFAWGKNQVYPGHNQDYHLIPFKAAISAGTRQMMPAYSRPIGTEWEEIAFAYNKGVVTDLLKNQLGFEGIVVSDWLVISDRPWGIENTTLLERTTRAIQAGCDILGGETNTELMIEAVNKSLLSMKRINRSVRKLLKEKFELGLFDDPFVNVDVAERVVGNEYFSRIGNETQRRAMTLLTNSDNLLPLPFEARQSHFYVEGVPISVMQSHNLSVVETPEEADYAFLRLDSPFKHNGGSGFLSSIHNGSLEYNATEKARQANIYTALPTVVDITLTRPAAVPEIADAAKALLVSYGSDPDAFLDVVLGVDGWGPEGLLPYDLPRSMAAVEASYEDVPFDTKDPLFRFGHGLRYAS